MIYTGRNTRVPHSNIDLVVLVIKYTFETSRVYGYLTSLLFYLRQVSFVVTQGRVQLARRARNASRPWNNSVILHVYERTPFQTLLGYI